MKYRVLVLMVFLFSLSQMSSLIISLYNYNKGYVSMFIEEEETETEAGEGMPDDKYYLSTHRLVPVAYLYISRQYSSLEISILTSYLLQPETPPPNFC